MDTVLSHLRELVAFDSRNPPRNITADEGMFPWLCRALPGFRHELTDLGNGCVSLLAVRGTPSTVFNVHMDTVPDSPQWSRPPLELKVSDDRATGLGACDIKGAAACLIAAAEQTDGPMALLFTSDEEHDGGRCIQHFLDSPHGFKRAIVSEPTTCRAVLAHRGIASVRIQFAGVAGHSSDSRALTDNALHRAAAWIGRAVEFAADSSHTYQNLAGLAFNVGTVKGGIKNNVIAPDARLTFGIRPLPGQDADVLLGTLRELAPQDHVASWERSFFGPSLPATAGDADDPVAEARRFARSLELDITEAVDFWTEASLFSAAGVPATVFGPGDIAQAHTADEWVSLAQLQTAFETYVRVIDRGL